MKVERLIYRSNPIGSLGALSAALGVSESEIQKVVDKIEDHYHENKPEIKPDGRERITFRLSDQLKKIQSLINNKVFGKVRFPAYLQGSIPDIENPRSYINNARIHCSSRIVISEDVSNYFHSIASDRVHRMWKGLFNFPEDVAEVLTRLTTLRGFVPQGGVTSSYIANLVLWDLEPSAVQKLRGLGFVYSRYIDDITISIPSSSAKIAQADITKSISIIYAMLNSAGVKVNRRKHKLMGSQGAMTVHRLNVNKGSPTYSRIKKDRLRMEIFNFQKELKTNALGKAEVQKKFASLNGKVRELSKFNSRLAERYFAQLKSLHLA